jgi:hypothetical protein
MLSPLQSGHSGLNSVATRILEEITVWNTTGTQRCRVYSRKLQRVTEKLTISYLDLPQPVANWSGKRGLKQLVPTAIDRMGIKLIHSSPFNPEYVVDDHR